MKSSNPGVSVLQVVLVFLAAVVVVIFAAIIKKIYYRFRYKKRYYVFPRTSVKGIANIAMVISIAVATLLLLTVLTAGVLGVVFRAYPGWRVSIEGILIKIGGLLFGPLIGMFIGAATDLLSVALTAGMFHYGYFLAAIAYGLLSGIVRSLITLSKSNQVRFALLGTITVIAVLIVTAIFLMVMQSVYRVELFNHQFAVSNWEMTLIIVGIFLAGLALMWVCMYIYNRERIFYTFASMGYWFRYRTHTNRYRKELLGDNPQGASDHQLKWFSKHNREQHEALFNLNNRLVKLPKEKENWVSYLAPVIISILICEVLVNTLMLPAFDASYSKSLNYEQWLAFRAFMLVIIAPLNIAVIYPVYRIVCPSMHYNYENDLVENLSVPLTVE